MNAAMSVRGVQTSWTAGHAYIRRGCNATIASVASDRR